MGPFEWRLQLVPDETEHQAYNVTIWQREFSADPDATGWRVVRTCNLQAYSRSHQPRSLLGWLLRCLSS